MKYIDYIKKYKNIIAPIEEIPVRIAVINIIQLIGTEIGGDFQERVEKFCDKELEILKNTKIEEMEVTSHK